jgi:CheY-like chemotaxis protein
MIMYQACTILVVEDDVLCRDILQQVLTLHNYAVKLARNGQEALDVLKTFTPDLILLDMKMPVMNGWEFSRQLIREKDHTIPFIVVSAAEDIEARAEETGANDWLPKPIDFGCLFEKLRKFLPDCQSVLQP